MPLEEFPPNDENTRALYALAEQKTVEQLNDDLAKARIAEGARVARAAKQFYTASGLALILISLGVSADLLPLVLIGLVSYFVIAFFLVRLMYVEFERQSRIGLCENAIRLKTLLDQQRECAESR
jgi:hypothetical protein